MTTVAAASHTAHAAPHTTQLTGTPFHVPSSGPPSAAYAHLVATGAITRDPMQLEALPALDVLFHAVRDYNATMHGTRDSAQQAAGRSGVSDAGGSFWQRMLTRSTTQRAVSQNVAPMGLYLWGGTGSGKTLLMDIAFATVPTQRKRRVHFHSFMLDVHARLHAIRSSGHRGDPIPLLAEALVSHAWLLALDEVQVTDVGDALIMRRLFDRMWQSGITVLATSNRPPEKLYASGLQRELFLPFISELRSRCSTWHLASTTDHRARVAAAAATTVVNLTTTSEATVVRPWVISDPSAPATAALDAHWDTLLAGAPEEHAQLLAQGRIVRVPRVAVAARAARFTFAQLCGEPLYSADYAAVARTFSTVLIDGVPLLSLSERNELRRFITLVDVLYEARVRLVASATVLPNALFAASREHAAATRIHDEAFAFDRTLSRLHEMCTEVYVQRSEWTPPPSEYE